MEYSTESTGEEIGQHKPAHPQSHQSLHRVRKPPAKPWRRPDLPQPPKVHRVDPHGFRRLVQRLTGKPQSTAAQVTAPTPIKVERRPPLSLQQPAATSEMNPMGSMSPSFYSSWCSFPLLSPGSMAALES